jgi:hypothetical protein
MDDVDIFDGLLPILGGVGKLYKVGIIQIFIQVGRPKKKNVGANKT